MATVQGLTKERMLEIEAASIVDGEIDVAGHLILTRHDDTTIDAGYMLASVPDASETVEGIVELATNAEVITGTDTTRVVTPAGLAAAGSTLVPDASATVKGRVELATDAETITGTDTVRAITPANFAAGLSAGLGVFLAALDLNDLSDVNLSGASDGNFLRRISSNWVPADVVKICTSSTHPSSPITGDLIYETDTQKMAIWNGTFWSAIFKGEQGRWPAGISQVMGATYEHAYNVNITGDSDNRFIIEAGGYHTWGNGTVAPDTNLYRSGVNELATDDDFFLTTAGKGIRIKEGSNAKMGISTLVGGTIVVSTTAVAANSRIFLTCNVPGGTPGFLRVSARTAGTSFTILSSSGTDTSQVAWVMFDPTP